MGFQTQKILNTILLLSLFLTIFLLLSLPSLPFFFFLFFSFFFPLPLPLRPATFPVNPTPPMSRVTKPDQPSTRPTVAQPVRTQQAARARQSGRRDQPTLVHLDFPRSSSCASSFSCDDLFSLMVLSFAYIDL